MKNILQENMRRFGTKNLSEQASGADVADITDQLGGFAQPGFTYKKDSDGTISKINSAGNTAATYSKSDNGWKWNEGNKQLSARLGSIFDKAIQSADVKQNNTTSPTNADSTKTTTPVIGTLRNILLNWDSATNVNLPVTGNTLVKIPNDNKTELAVKNITDGFVNALDDLAGITVKDTSDVVQGLLKLNNINVRRSNYTYAAKWNVPKDNMIYWALKDQRDIIPLLGIINSLYLEDEGISLIEDLNKLVNGKLSSAQREDPIYKRNINTIKKLLTIIKI